MRKAHSLRTPGRPHFGDGNENVGRKEIVDKARIEALKILLRYEEPDRGFVEMSAIHDLFRFSVALYVPEKCRVGWSSPRPGVE